MFDPENHEDPEDGAAQPFEEFEDAPGDDDV